MAITLKKTVAVLDGHCVIEEAETLLEWLLENPRGKINLKGCEYIHTAVLQVLIATKPAISALPENDWLKKVIQSAGMESESSVV